MKTKLLFLTTLFTISTHLISAQCNVNASDFGNNTNVSMYNISSSNANPVEIEIILNTNNTLTLNLGANFATAEGPDIRAFLLNSDGETNAAIENKINTESSIASYETIEIGLVGALAGYGNPITPINGAKSLTESIPNNIDIEDYDKLLFYCEMFGQFWDIGDFTSFSSSNCSILSVEENILSENINFYPNPANENITITNNKKINAGIEIYNVLGKKVLQTEHNTIKEQTINLSSLKSGVYLVQITAEGNHITKRLIKQ
ncbi:MAG: T9SS type A sorting domain-containing protein [Algibacter sp.]